MTNTTRKRCETCDVRIPASQPKLYCSICLKLRHAKCEKLSRLEASDIIQKYGQHWSCYKCTSSILPINTCMDNIYLDIKLILLLNLRKNVNHVTVFPTRREMLSFAIGARNHATKSVLRDSLGVWRAVNQ